MSPATLIRDGGRGQIVAFFQPKIDLTNGLICGFEALVRRVDRGRVVGTPQHLVEVAEQHGLLSNLWSIVMEHVCVELAQQQPDARRPVAINICPTQLQDVTFPDQAKAIVVRHGIDPGLIEFEITEQSPIADVGEAAIAIHRFRQYGFSMVIDDFGIGNTKIALLSELPVAGVKLDRIFVSSCHRKNIEIIRGLVDICHHLDKYVVLEGIETQQHHAIAQASQADFGQGFYYGRPMDGMNARFAEQVSESDQRRVCGG